MSKQYIISLAITMAAALAMGTGMAPAADSYGAIAFSPSTHGQGYAFGSSNREAAQRIAVSECVKYSGGNDCLSVITIAKGCAVLAVDAVAYASSADERLDFAKRAAIRNCQSAGGSNCWVLRWLCQLSWTPQLTASAQLH